MKEFIEPEIEIVELKEDDVIVSSGCATECSGYCYFVCSNNCSEQQQQG